LITDLRQLRHIAEVARAESVTRAAHALFITQSALTKSIADVEARLGVQLFQRLPRGVRLTDAGRIFVEKARQILGDVDDLMRGIVDFRDLNAGSLRIGIAPALYQAFAVAPVAEMAARFRGLRIEVVTGSAEDIVPRVLGGELGAMLGNVDYLRIWPELETTPVAPLHVAYIARRDHPLAALASPKEMDLLQYPLVYPTTIESVHSDVTDMYVRHNMAPVRPQYVCDDFSLVKRILSRTNALSPVLSLNPDFSGLKGEFLILKDVAQTSPYTLGLAKPKGRQPSPAILAYGDLVARSIRRHAD